MTFLDRPWACGGLAMLVQVWKVAGAAAKGGGVAGGGV